MRSIVLVLLLATGLVPTLACAHPHRHGHTHGPKVRTVAVLEAEHHDTKIVVVHKKPAPRARCWKHAGHWHCRR